MSLVQIADSVEFAREVASDIEARELPDEAMIHDAVDIMNHHLFGVGENRRALLRADEAFLIPVDEADAELLLTDEAIAQARVDNVIMRAKVDSFMWLGSVGVTGFGLRTFGVNILAPRVQHVPTAFVPLDAVGARLATERHVEGL